LDEEKDPDDGNGDEEFDQRTLLQPSFVASGF
jgi:hypothetical protein